MDSVEDIPQIGQMPDGRFVVQSTNRTAFLQLERTKFIIAISAGDLQIFLAPTIY